MIGVCFLVIFMTSSSDLTRQYFGLDFVGFYAKIRVFRALDRVTSVFGSNVTPKKFQLFLEFPRVFWGFP